MTKLKDQSEYTTCPPITTEWAKQLIHDYFSRKVDFENTRCYIVDGRFPTYVATELMLPSLSVLNWENTPNTPMDRWIKKEYVDLKWITDPINQERHYIGFGAATNVCFVAKL